MERLVFVVVLRFNCHSLVNRQTFEGNVIAWDAAEFELLNMTEYEASMQEICTPVRPGHVIMPVRRNFTSHRSICTRFRGIMSVIGDEQTQDALNEQVSRHEVCRDKHGIGKTNFAVCCTITH